MATQSEFETYYESGTLGGLIRSGYLLLKARRVPPRSGVIPLRHRLADLINLALYGLLIVIPATVLDIFQRLRTWITGKPRDFPEGFWQFYLHWGLREDLGHFTNETIGYHRDRPQGASEVDDLTAWVMAIIQFLWGYEDLMGVFWDEWIMLRLIAQAAEQAGLSNDKRFHRLVRQWEVRRPYTAPLNGTYADVRRAAFQEFTTPLLAALPKDLRFWVFSRFKELADSEREAFQKQMSLLAYLVPGRIMDTKVPIPLWDACIGLVIGGQYYLIDVVAHDEQGAPLVYGQGGTAWPLQFRNGTPINLAGEQLTLREGQLYRIKDGEWMGYLDMPPVSQIKWQLQEVLRDAPRELPDPDQAVDILLTETPRREQSRLRKLLPQETQFVLKQITRAPIILNWDNRPRDRFLAQLRRAHRGVGDHALTVMRTESSIIFDQSHIFFDGVWALAIAEVLTTAAIQWCRRCISIPPSEARPVIPLRLEASDEFLEMARQEQQDPEVSAETIIWDISQISKLREMLEKRGMRLTVNDLLVITRIFHAAHYKPSPPVQAAIDSLRANARTPTERRAVAAIERSLERGRLTNPALYIPVDASPYEPRERLYPDTFRNLSRMGKGNQETYSNLVWAWDDTWDAYQSYRKFDPSDTPEGIAAFKVFARQRDLLLKSLADFSLVLAANKAVATRGKSLTVAIAKLLVGLPTWLQKFLNSIPEYFPVLNEIIKGDEVYSNVGRVAVGSSLTRFMTAKDDGNTKALAWGVMADDQNRLVVTMRDFRPHIKPLIKAGRFDLAQQLAQDYVVSYTADLIGLVARLSAMLQAEIPGG